MKKILIEKWHIFALVFVMLVAFFVRIWNLDDTLYFNLDQARDINLVSEAWNKGPGELPLLGPRAAGTFLRLGPIFYYFQYLSGVISGSAEPLAMVFPEILFSVLTIPLLFVFFSQFFKKWNSVILSSLFGLSFLAVQYSRFAWNPNQIPFWSILLMLCAFKVSTSENKKRAGMWLLGAALAYAILSQLHFTSLLAFPLIIGIFWLFYRPRKIKVGFWIGAFAILAFFYIPMFLSELNTNWNNVDQFVYALTHKSKDYPLGEKIEKSFDLHSQYYSLSLTSYGNTDDVFFKIVFVAMILFAFWRVFQLWREGMDKNRKAFMFLVFCWFLVLSLLYTKLAFTVLKPRFWLLVMAIPYIILGLFFETVYRTGKKKRGKYVVGLVASLLLVANSYAIGYWYWSVQNQKEPEGYVRKLVLKQNNLVGIKQVKQVVDYLSQKHSQSGKQICYHAEPAYHWGYMYLFELRYPEVLVKRLKFSMEEMQGCQIFSIDTGGSSEKIELPSEYKKFFAEKEKRLFGKVTVWEIELKEDEFVDYLNEKEEKSILQKESEDSSSDDAENVKSEDETEEEDNEDEKKDNKKPKTKERVLWRDVFEGTYED